MEQKISQDVKAAMLAKDTQKVSVLRSLKSAFIYVKVAPGYEGTTADTLPDVMIIAILAKESKKRQESADSFVQAGKPDRADAEMAEKAIIDGYLPAQLSEDEVRALVSRVVDELDEVSPKMIGQVITAVKQQAGQAADGALIARLTKESLDK